MSLLFTPSSGAVQPGHVAEIEEQGRENLGRARTRDSRRAVYRISRQRGDPRNDVVVSSVDTVRVQRCIEPLVMNQSSRSYPRNLAVPVPSICVRRYM